jgi:hypothetical protein
MQDQDFYRRAGQAAPGMFDFGVGLYGSNAGRNEAKERINASGMAEFDAASRSALAQAGSMDPRAAAAERFGAAQGLLAPKDATDMQALQRMLHAQGQGGAATYGGVEPGGAPINPQMAAYLAEKNKRDALLAYHSLEQGENQTDRMLQRAGMLQGQANARQNTAQGNKVPSRSTANFNLLRAGGDLFKDLGGLNGIGGLFQSGGNWLSGLGQPKWFDSMDSGSIDW